MNANVTKIGVCLLMILVLLFSCGKEVSAPEGLLSEEKMGDILVDVHLAEASLQGFLVRDRDSVAQVYYQHIFRIHEIEESSFYVSMDHYSLDPKAWGRIYGRAMQITTERDLKGK